PYGRNAGEARRESALLVLQQIAALAPNLPLFLTGDFNSPADGEIYQLLNGEQFLIGGLCDAWKTAEGTLGPEGTVHGFGRIAGRRIDWILHRNSGQTVRTETVTPHPGGLDPSGHYPV